MVGGGGRLCRLLQRCLKNGGVGSVMSTHTVKSVSRDDRGGRKGGGRGREVGRGGLRGSTLNLGVMEIRRATRAPGRRLMVWELTPERTRVLAMGKANGGKLKTFENFSGHHPAHRPSSRVSPGLG